MFYSKKSLGKGYIDPFIKSRFPSIRIDEPYQKQCFPLTHDYVVIQSVIEDTFCYQHTILCLNCGLVKVGDSMWVKDFARKAYVSKEEIIPSNLSDDFRLWWNDIGKNQPVGTWQELNKNGAYTHYSDILIKIFSMVTNSVSGWVTIDDVSKKFALNYRCTEDYLYLLANTGFLEWESVKIPEGYISIYMPLTLNDKNEIVPSKYHRVFKVKTVDMS